MTRAIARVLLVIAAMAFAVLCIPNVVSAQDDSDTTGYNGAAINIPTTEALEYDGPFSLDDGTEVLGTTATNDGSASNVGGRGPSFEIPDVQPGQGTGGGDAGEGLAHTGSDVEPIVAISVGLLAVGGSALVSSRRRLGRTS